MGANLYSERAKDFFVSRLEDNYSHWYTTMPMQQLIKMMNGFMSQIHFSMACPEELIGISS